MYQHISYLSFHVSVACEPAQSLNVVVEMNVIIRGR